MKRCSEKGPENDPEKRPKPGVRAAPPLLPSVAPDGTPQAKLLKKRAFGIKTFTRPLKEFLKGAKKLVKSSRGALGGYVLEKPASEIKLSNIIFAVDEEVKTLNCKKDSKKGCGGRTVKCITHNLWDDLEKHINSFFESKNLSDLVLKQEKTF